MPILPPTPTAPYDTVESALQLARVRVNDAMVSIAGEILTDTAPFSQTIVNGGWRRLQQYLANQGYNRVVNEVILTIPPVTTTSTDPAIQVWLNWSQYFDGANYFSPPTTGVLPQDLISPLRMWERWSGQNAIFREMVYQLDGLPTYPKTTANQMFEWRNDAIYMPGSLMEMDLRIRYAAYLPDFIDQGDVAWYNSPMPIMYCRDAMANYIAYEFCKARGDQGADDFMKKAEEAANQIFNRDVRAKQRTNARRRPYGSYGNSGQYGRW